MDPTVKVDPLISQGDINMHNLNIESNLVESVTSSRDICHPLSFTPHVYLYIYLFNQSDPSPFSSDTLDSHVSGSNGDQVQGGHTAQVEEKKSDDFFF